MQKSRPTQHKRARERAKQEKQQQKAARRQEAKVRKPSGLNDAGEDPDIAGIVPGPQASPWAEFGDLGDLTDTEETEEPS
jgi:hypothetical protein